MTWYWIFLAGAIAFLVAAAELWVTTYPDTFAFVLRCPELYLFCGIHTALAMGIAALSGQPFLKNALMPGVSPAVQAVFVGLTIKALLRADLFTVVPQRDGTPKKAISLEQITNLIFPRLLRRLVLAEYNAVKSFVAYAAQENTDLSATKKKVLGSLPKQGLDKKDVTKFRNDVNGAREVDTVLGHYLRFVGHSAFEHLFPKRK